jgi:hypothetical protein
MSKWTLAFCLALSLCFTAEAKVHRGRPRAERNFPAKSDSVLLENQAAEEMGAHRFFTQSEVDGAVSAGVLVPFYNHYTTYVLSPKLPINRRFALPVTVAFVTRLSVEFYQTFHQPLVVDSAIRPATTQRSLTRVNRNAAPAYGLRASSHERGTTVDISKHLSPAQQRWMINRLLYYRAIGWVLVIQEKSCYHIFVRGEDHEFAGIQGQPSEQYLRYDED